MKNEITALEGQNGELEIRLQTANSLRQQEKSELQQVISNLTEEYSKLEGDNTFLDGENLTLKEEEELFRQENTTLKAEKSDLKSENERIARDAKDSAMFAAFHVKHLLTRNTRLDEKVAQLKEEKDELFEKFSNLTR